MTAQSLKNALLNGDYNAASLESALASDTAKGALRDIGGNLLAIRTLFSYPQSFEPLLDSDRSWNELLNSEIALYALATSVMALIELCKRGPQLGSVLSNTARAQLLLNACNYELLCQQVNKTGSALHRQVFNTSATWTKPTNLYASAVAGFGAGGSAGRSNSSSHATPGAGGGQAKTAILDHTAIVANVTVTVPAGPIGATSGSDPGTAGSPSTFGGFFSVSGGGAGAGGDDEEQNGGVGGGTTENGGRSAMTDTDFEGAAWQAVNAAQKGGRGGRSISNSRNGTPGLNLDGGGLGRYGYSRSTGGEYGGGGGGSTVGGTSPGPVNAMSPGGGAPGNWHSNNGKNGGPGQIIHYWVTDA
ncbi:MAG: hypothetical protein ACO1RX_08360 [Candidatus Sericytochromatia bacterium]